MENAYVTAGIFVVPTILLVVAFWLSGRKVEWEPLVWAGFAVLVNFLLLRSKGVIPVPYAIAGLTLNWIGKTMALAGTLSMLYVLPRVSLRAAGVIWTQNQGSLISVMLTGIITLVSATGAAMFAEPTVNISLENLLFQSTLPGLDEELFFRRLLLLLFHQAFGKGLNVLGADTGWGF